MKDKELNIGDKVYTIDSQKLKINCNYCNKGKVFLIDKPFTCPNCQGLGKIDGPQIEYVIHEKTICTRNILETRSDRRVTYKDESGYDLSVCGYFTSRKEAEDTVEKYKENLRGSYNQPYVVPGSCNGPVG